MPLAGALTAHAVLLVLVLMSASPSCRAAHNITAILAAHPPFADFNRLLTTTVLASDINTRTTLTVLAVDGPGMAPLLARGLPHPALRHVLSLHVLVDYYDAAKLHSLPGGSALVSTLYQASGDAPGSAGMVNITQRQGGRVSFAPHDTENAPPTVFYVKSIQETPYNISVLQVSAVISSPSAEAPAPPEQKVNLTDLMSKSGCKGFADLVASTADAAATYEQSIDDELTVFCPADKAVEGFVSRFKNLTAGSQLALLLYHGVPMHYSLEWLKANNGDMNTLATDGAKSYNFTVRNDGDTVTLLTAAQKAARVTGTIRDKDPLAVYVIDAVLLPRELFNASDSGSAPALAPAPAPAPALAPSAKHQPPPLAPGSSDAEAPSPRGDDGAPGDADQNGASGAAGWRLAIAVAATVPAIALAMW